MALVIIWADTCLGGDNQVIDHDYYFLGHHIHFGGFERLKPKFDTWNDEVSSLEVLGGKVRFWSDAFHEGKFVDLGPGKYDLPALIQRGIANDSISSVDFSPFA